MYEILRRLGAGATVLDLGCAKGSFDASSTLAYVVRYDREAPVAGVQGDAARLPFRSHSIDAIIANHSLEHFDDLDGVLSEIGRIIRSDGALFVSVPDASTLTDRVYRWLARGGGHVNAFVSAEDLVRRVAARTGLRHVATRTLCSSLSFLNRRNTPAPPPRRLLLVGGGTEWSLLLYTWLSRRLDAWLGTRLSVYGWALYFGAIHEAIDTRTLVNVCILCGSGVEVEARGWLYNCPCCGARNVRID